jgi:SAM-dependent methyltransferase
LLNVEAFDVARIHSASSVPRFAVEYVLDRAIGIAVKGDAMDAPSSDTLFAGSIPELYESHLVPLIFEPYAVDLANRVAALQPSRVLETAAGTGVVTRAMARALPALVDLVATDLNQPMLDRARAVGTQRPVRWEQADATRLPFGDASFDVVACQFGVMFFPDKARAFSEARRVLRSGGMLLFSVWDRIEENEFADTVTTQLGALFPSDPPLFMARTPHGYFDPAAVSADLANAGFSAPPHFETVAARSRALSAHVPAIAYCQGTPLRSEIEARSGASLADATSACAAAIAKRFGDGPVDGKIQAQIVIVRN